MYKTFLKSLTLKMYKTFLNSLALKKISKTFYKHGSLDSTACFKNKNGSLCSTVCFKSLREPGLNRAPMVDFLKLYKHAIKHQPPEAYTCLLYPSEHGSLGIDRTGGRTCVRITFSGKYGGIDLGRHHHNLANALTLYTLVLATVSFKCHDA